MIDASDWTDLLACPVDAAPLLRNGNDELVCSHGHRYPVVDGVPVLLRSDVEQTIGVAQRSIDAANEARKRSGTDRLFIDTLGITDVEREAVLVSALAGRSPVDPVVSYLVAATNGILYKSIAGKLETVPIPELRLPLSTGELLLDIGCNWGRWSIAAARKGYRPIGLDPSLGAVLAAQRLARNEGLPFHGIVGDARYLPLKSGSMPNVFSYSVLQHFSRHDARAALTEVGRVTQPGGLVKIQMASCTGIRSAQHILRRRGRQPASFDVRYWTPRALTSLLADAIGPSTLEVDCYFGLGLQPSDMAMMSAPKRALIRTSEVLRKIANVVTPLAYVADSVYITARKATSGQ